MYIVPKIIRPLVRTHIRSQIKMVNSTSKLQTSHRSIHCSTNLCIKMYMENENKYAYSILESKGYAVGLTVEPSKNNLTEDQYKQILQENWSKEDPKRLFEVFAMLAAYCGDRQLCISNQIFDDLIDNLTDNIKHASDKELETLFHSLLRWPETVSIRTRNYIEVWAALDDVCLERLRSWNFDEMLHFISLFFMLNVPKYSDFSQKAINKLASKAKQLTPAQMVQTMFFIGVIRKQPFDMHNMELQAINCFDELSIEDLAIMSMGFFKSKTPIRSMDFVAKIIERIIANPKDIHEVALAALLKVIRYSAKVVTDDRLYRLLDALQHEVPRLSVMCLVHLALLGTSTLTLHEQCLTAIAKKMENSMESARMKDLERLVLTYGVFNFKPKTEINLFENIIKELRKPERLVEIKNHPKSFACCVNYLSVLDLYPVDLMDRVLSPKFLDDTYGSYCYQYGREVLNIHNTSLIFCADIQMNRLPDKAARILAKKYTDYVPDEDSKKQYNVLERFMLDVLKVLREDYGGDQYVIADHVQTHYQRGDIIMCKAPDGLPLPVIDHFKSADFGFLRRPPDNNHWIVLIIVGRNSLIKGTNSPSGIFQHKVKELKKMGYHVELVIWSVYNTLKTKGEKSAYLKMLIKNALK